MLSVRILRGAEYIITKMTNTNIILFLLLLHNIAYNSAVVAPITLNENNIGSLDFFIILPNNLTIKANLVIRLTTKDEILPGYICIQM